jgi:hypothetical protein
MGGMCRRRVEMNVAMGLATQAIGKKRGVKCATVVQKRHRKRLIIT